jgi:hypothetical protein
MRRTAAAVVAVVAALAVVILAPVANASAQVLRVGTFNGIPGQFSSIQAAVNAARPGDWILVGPGDYKTRSVSHPRGRTDLPAAVLITKAGLYLRGMNRNRVIVDGTRPGSSPCSTRTAAQSFGPRSANGSLGLNGILVWKARDVWIQNLTACNFLSGTGDTGNEIWWNGGDRTGRVGGFGYYGSYLNATTDYYNPQGQATAAQYGIFSSNWSGGTWKNTYASNFSDSGYYIGACQQICNQTIDGAKAEFSSLGYSGSNSGGAVIVKNSEFDQNSDGFDTNSQNGDNPPPQNGACPNNGISPITHTHSCWVLMNSYIHDNNNPNVPGVGAAGDVAVGTGLSLTGARNDTVMRNRIVRNNAWGVLISVFPDSGPPCTGGTLNFKFLITFGCLYDQWGNAILNNSFRSNGSFAHVTNGDIAASNLEGGHPTNCYRGNTDPAAGGATTSPPNLQQTHPICDGTTTPATPNLPFVLEQLCSNLGAVAGLRISCPGGHPYPERTSVILHPLPRGLPSMPNPCAGVPANPWCPGTKPVIPVTPPPGLG